MIRRFSAFVMVGATMFAAGCGDDDKGPITPTDTTSGADSTPVVPKPTGFPYCTPAEATATRSGVTCVETNTGATPITQPANCTMGDTILTRNGLSYPWTGATVGNKTFSCNSCPNGHPDLQGRYRIHGWKEGSEQVDYSIPNPVTDQAWVLFVDGNTFYSAEHDAIRQRSSQSRGYYFCSMKVENGAKHLYFSDVENSNPEGIGNWSRTDSILSQNGGNNLLIRFFHNAADTTDKSGIDFPFCRIGSVTDGQTCTDPFGG